METEAGMRAMTNTRAHAGDYGVIKEINTLDGGYRYIVGCWVDLRQNELVLIHIMPPVGEKIAFSDVADAWRVAMKFNGKVVAMRFRRESGLDNAVPGGLEDAVQVYEWERVSHMLRLGKQP